MEGFGKSGAMEQAHDWTSMNYRWATKGPSQHLVGKQIGLVGVALYAGKRGGVRRLRMSRQARLTGSPPQCASRNPQCSRAIATSPEWSRVTASTASFRAGAGCARPWRGHHALVPGRGAQRCGAADRTLDECETELWLLTLPESRHLRRVAAVYSHLAQGLNMP